MKKLILALVFMFITGICYADVYIIYNTATKEIYSISNEDDAVMPKTGYTKTILKQNLKDILLQYPPEYYKYDNNKFILNMKKVDEESIRQQQAEERIKEEKIVSDRIRKDTIEKLKSEGITFKYIDK